MTTRILDAEIVLKEKKLPLVNTGLLIHIDWDIVLEKKENTAEIQIKYLEVYGDLEWLSQKDGYKQKTSINFRTDENWKIQNENNLTPFVVHPFYAKIDFDKKEIKIQLV